MPASRPTDTSPTWATDATFPAGVDPWSGAATKVAPSSGERAAGFVPAVKALAQRMNYLLNVLGGWAAWLADHSGADDEWSYPTPKTENRPTGIWLSDEITEGDWLATAASSEKDAMLDAVHLSIPLQVRVGETLTGCVLKVAPQSARATVTNRMRARLYKVTQNFGNGSPPSADAQVINSPSNGTTDRMDSGSTGTQLLSLVLTTPIVATEDMTFFIDLTSGNDSGTAGKHDRYYGAYAAVTKPGPR